MSLRSKKTTSRWLVALALVWTCTLPPDASGPREAVSLQTITNSCNGLDFSQYYPNDPWTWINAVNAGSNGYIPAGDYTIPWHDGSFPIFRITRVGAVICGDGPSSVLRFRQSDSGVPYNAGNLEYGFYVTAPHVTIKDLSLVGSGYGDPEGNGGTGVRFNAVDAGIAQGLTITGFGTVGIDSYRSSNLYIQSNSIDMAYRQMGVWVRETSAIPGVHVRNNQISRTLYEGIIIELASNVEVLYNTITDCVDGIVINAGSNNNAVRHNRVVRAGGGIPYPGRVGLGIHVNGNSNSNFIDANVIENMTTPGLHAHGIGISPVTVQSNNMISTNTIWWDQTPADPNQAAIWNGGKNTKMWYNVVQNAPIGILHNGDHPGGEIRENNILSASTPIWNSGTMPASRTCNRIRGTLETSGCFIDCAGEGCSYVGNSRAYSYFTDYQCAGSEYIPTTVPYTWNGTGKRSITARLPTSFPSRRSWGGLCEHWCTNGDCPNGSFSPGNTYKVYR